MEVENIIEMMKQLCKMKGKPYEKNSEDAKNTQEKYKYFVSLGEEIAKEIGCEYSFKGDDLNTKNPGSFAGIYDNNYGTRKYINYYWCKLKSKVYEEYAIHVAIQLLSEKDFVYFDLSLMLDGILQKSNDGKTITKKIDELINDKIKENDTKLKSLGCNKNNNKDNKVKLYVKNYNKWKIDEIDSKSEEIRKEIDGIIKDAKELFDFMKNDIFPTKNIIVKKIIEIENDCKQVVLTGAPGTGKSFSAKEYIKYKLKEKYVGDDFETKWSDKNSEINKQWKMVQFHPSFDYTDFVEGIRPVKIKEKDIKGKVIGEKTAFVRMDGVFKKLCREAAKKENKDKAYYFFIDEINRADLSKVFGELMYCLEEDYRGEENTIETQYSNLDTYEMVDGYAEIIKDDIFKDGFYIPENVFIIGTMNDIDRSVDTFDYALRRRFRWINVKVDDSLLLSVFRNMKLSSSIEMTDDQIRVFVDRIMKMNRLFGEIDEYKKIFRTQEDYYVGPAYFGGLFKGQSMETIWTNKVEPLLKEYVRGREVDTFIENARKRLLDSDNGMEIEPDFEDNFLIKTTFNLLSNIFTDEKYDKVRELLCKTKGNKKKKKEIKEIKEIKDINSLCKYLEKLVIGNDLNEFKKKLTEEYNKSNDQPELMAKPEEIG